MREAPAEPERPVPATDTQRGPPLYSHSSQVLASEGQLVSSGMANISGLGSLQQAVKQHETVRETVKRNPGRASKLHLSDLEQLAQSKRLGEVCKKLCGQIVVHKCPHCECVSCSKKSFRYSETYEI